MKQIKLIETISLENLENEINCWIKANLEKPIQQNPKIDILMNKFKYVGKIEYIKTTK